MAYEQAQETRENAIQLSFKSTEGDSHEVPLDYFTDALDAMQEAIYLLAMQEEGVEVRTREKTNSDLRAKFGIKCAPPVPGSVVLDTYVGNPSHDLQAGYQIESVMTNFAGVAKAVKDQDQASLAKFIPDTTRRMKVVQTFRRLVPKAGVPWTLDVSPAKQIPFHLSAADQAKVTALLKRSYDDEAVKTVTGSLARIDFDKRILTLTYPVTNRDLECLYDESIEGLLLENPRELIQVTGTVVMDEEGHPTRIKDVENIEELDLSPFMAYGVKNDNWNLRFHEPLVLEVFLDESKQLLCAEHPALDIDVYAFTREELLEELGEQVIMLWQEYALASPEDLTPRAHDLRSRLLEAIQEVPRA